MKQTPVQVSTGLGIPRPEYPRPDWQREDWLNLNGVWQFVFDPEDQGLDRKWQIAGTMPNTEPIVVPFSWASPVSGIGKDVKGIAWYSRIVRFKPVQPDSRVFLRFGAVDYQCEVWVNEISVGSHTGGYSAFEFDVTAAWKMDGDNYITVRVQDEDLPHQTRGKQGYGEIRGIWQTVWLEARPINYLDNVRFVTQTSGTVHISGVVRAHEPGKAVLRFSFNEGAVQHELKLTLAEGSSRFETSLKVAEPQLWSPESPFLYEGTVSLECDSGCADVVSTYFGIREISAATFGERDYKWITLNGKPVFLNGTLDQSFVPESYFTFPDEKYIRDEIWRLKRLGLNFVRIHIKPEEPLKLYWADKLGILVMEDMPCFWGEPDERARTAYESEAAEIIARDFNHPSIISWVVFNETWGLFTQTGEDRREYLHETQEWVRSVYKRVKQENPTRLVEDNSVCNYDHVESDLNTWHFYLNGYEKVRSHIEEAVDKTYPGSEWNYTGGNVQTDAPLMNSECGAVWGIEGSAGDSDLAWHYRYMINEFRRHDKMCGFIFTEFHDVINEFNGYYRMDRQEKDFGYDAFIHGMSLRDLHAPDFIVIDAPPCQTVSPGESVEVRLLASSYTDRYHGQQLQVKWNLVYDNLTGKKTAGSAWLTVSWDGYGVKEIGSLHMSMPGHDAVAVLAVTLETAEGEVIHRNFITFDVQSGLENGLYDLEGEWISMKPADLVSSSWEYAWNALNDHKVNGGPGGYAEYAIELPKEALNSSIGSLEVIFEAGAKVILDKDKELAAVKPHDISYMHGAKADPGMNINSYFMTDEVRKPSRVDVILDEERIGEMYLPDDPADSRGVLSWHYQSDDRKLEEAGSYGYLQRIQIPSRLLPGILDRGRFTLRLCAEQGGLALYGRNAGRYPADIIVHWTS